MVKSFVAALALAGLPSALAFRNTSPFFLFSTADLPINNIHGAIAQSAKVSDQVTQSLEKCPSKTFFIIRQDGVASADYLDTVSAPRLALYMGGQRPDVKSSMIVSEVVGDVDYRSVSKYLEVQCGAEVVRLDHDSPAKPTGRAKDAAFRVFELVLPVPAASPRARALILGTHDKMLDILISSYADSRDYTVIYTTSPPTDEQASATFQTQHTYEMDDTFAEAVHMELKRDTAMHKRATAHKGGLFESYSFLSPGLFMGITVSIPLFLILLVGIKAIAGLEVSYFAFSKEMGPTAQKKLQ